MKNILNILITTILIGLFLSCNKTGQFNNGMATIQDRVSKKYGYVNENNELIIEKEYDWGGDFHSNFATVEKNSKRGVINRKGVLVIPMIYKNVMWLGKDFFKVDDGKKIGVYNSKNEEVIPIVATEIRKLHNHKYFEILLKKDGENYLSFFDINGKKLLEVNNYKVKKIIGNYIVLERDFGQSNRVFDYKIYDLNNPKNPINKLAHSEKIDALKTKNGLYFMLNNIGFNSKVSVVNQYGKIIIPQGKYSHIWHYNENVFVVQVTGQGTGYADLEGNLFLKAIFNNAKPFQDGIAKVTLNEKTFFINKHGACFKDCPTKKWLDYHNIINFRIDNDSYQKLIKKGVQESKLKDYSKSIITFNHAIVENPLDYEAYHNRGLSYFLLNNLDKAHSDFDRAIELNPSNSDTYYLRGNLLQRRGYPSQAISQYEKTIELNPYHIDSYMKSAIVYGKQGNKNKSCDFFKQACELGNTEACAGYLKFCE